MRQSENENDIVKGLSFFYCVYIGLMQNMGI